MVCGVSVDGRESAPTPQAVDCDRCALRLLRTGQALGLDEMQIAKWTFEELHRFREETKP